MDPRGSTPGNVKLLLPPGRAGGTPIGLACLFMAWPQGQERICFMSALPAFKRTEGRVNAGGVRFDDSQPY